MERVRCSKGRLGVGPPSTPPPRRLSFKGGLLGVVFRVACACSLSSHPFRRAAPRRAAPHRTRGPIRFAFFDLSREFSCPLISSEIDVFVCLFDYEEALRCGDAKCR